MGLVQWRVPSPTDGLQSAAGVVPAGARRAREMEEAYTLGAVRGLRPVAEAPGVDEVLLSGACGALTWVPETAVPHLRLEISRYVRHVWTRRARRRRATTCGCFGCAAPPCLG